VIGPVVSPREAGQRPMVCIREERLSEAITGSSCLRAHSGWPKGWATAPSSFMQRALRKCLVLVGESPRTSHSHVKIFDQAIPD
jgi:hypothetical protein